MGFHLEILEPQKKDGRYALEIRVPNIDLNRDCGHVTSFGFHCNWNGFIHQDVA